jgi:hypothetical protein
VATRFSFSRLYASRYFSRVVPGVVLASSGADGLIRPRRFSGVLD